MKIKLFTLGLIALLVLGCIPVDAIIPTTQPTIDPSASDSVLCGVPILNGIINCEQAATGQGPAGPPGPAGSGNITNYFNLSMGGGNFTSLSNITNFFNIGFMNQTPNMTAGPAGSPGAQGPAGINGTAGPQGPAGLDNMTAGPQGPQGVPGAANMTAGPQGLQGIQGIPGLDNMTAGPQGPQGIQGVNGTPGAQGPQGIQGIPGLDNMTAGPQGPQGVPGLDNMTAGPQGPQGVPGAANMTAGPQGPTGPMNQTANQTAGPQGNPGPNNDAWYLWINGTRSMTGNLSMGSYYINNLISGGLGSDAVNRTFILGQGFITSTFNLTYDQKPSSNYNSTYDSKPSSTFNATYDAKPSSNYNSTYDAKTSVSAWTAWTPSYTWGTANPTGITTYARYMKEGKIVWWNIYLQATDSKATTSLTITNLPYAVSSNQQVYAAASTEDYNTAQIYIATNSIFYYDGNIYVHNWVTPTTGQQVSYWASGFYESTT